jgi:P27 family predicted phage terminase small subunit
LINTKPGWTEPDPFVAGRPKMPAGLSANAEAEWRRLVPKLVKRETVTKVDASALEVHCRCWSRYIVVATLAEENPLETVYWTTDGVERSKTVESPASKMASRLEGQIARFLKEFGATPASRAHTKAAPPPPPPPDPQDRLLDRTVEQPLIVDDTPEIDIFAIDTTTETP